MLFEVGIAHKECGFVVLGFEKQGMEITVAGLFQVAAREIRLRGLHHVVYFLALGESSFRTVLRKLEYDLQQAAVIAQLLCLEGDLAGANPRFLSQIGIVERGGISHDREGPRLLHSGVVGMIGGYFLEREHGPNKFAVVKELQGVVALGIVRWYRLCRPALSRSWCSGLRVHRDRERAQWERKNQGGKDATNGCGHSRPPSQPCETQ